MTETSGTTAPAAVETITYRDIPIKGPSRGAYDKSIDKKHKSYTATALVGFEIDDGEQVSKDGVASISERIRTVLKPYAEAANTAHHKKCMADLALQWPRPLSATVSAVGDWSDTHKGKHLYRFYIDVTVTEVRPKDLPEDAAKIMAILIGSELTAERKDFDNKVRTAIMRGIDDTIDVQSREKRRTDAERIARHLAKHADKDAREICRFDQKLAGLEGELKAEREIQLKKLVEKMVADAEVNQVMDEAGIVFDKRSVNAGIIHAKDVFPTILPSFFPSDMGSDFVKAEEV
jgi:hypothetical protein